MTSKDFSDRDLSTDRNVERIAAAAKANAGLWLKVKEREMKKRAQKAAAMRRGRSKQTFRSELKPSLSEIAGTLVTRMFGNRPPAVIAFVEPRMLEAVTTERGPIASGREHTGIGNGKYV